MSYFLLKYNKEDFMIIIRDNKLKVFLFNNEDDIIRKLEKVVEYDYLTIIFN